MSLDGAGRAADERDELLELLLAEEGIELAPKSITSRDRSQPGVLSYAQERMWFLDRLDGEDSNLGIQTSVALLGALNVDALRRSIVEIVDRHEILRTVVAMDAGDPRPAVLPIEAMQVHEIDVDGDEQRLEEVLRTESHRPFDLSTEPPIAITLIRVTDEHHVLSILMHHIASDGSSFEVFSREFGALYAAFAEGSASPLPPLPIQYEDFATWQRHEAGDVFERQLAYWREQLAAPLPTFEIPTDRPRPARHTFEGASVSARLDPDLVHGLEALCKDSGATMFMTMLAAFEIVAARHAGESDVIVGTPIAGRVRLEIEPLIGPFLNTLVIRNSLQGRPTFRELLERVRTTCVDAYANQEVPFELLLADLQPPRDLSRTPLFSIFFNMTHLKEMLTAQAPAGLRIEQLASPDVAANFDLTMYVNERPEGVDTWLVYNRNLYDADHMERFAAQYQRVLAQIVADPDCRIDDLDLGGVAAESSATPDPTAPLDDTWFGSVPASVRAVAERSPDRVCVVDDTESLSYGDVAARMERVATWLGQRDVGPGDVVAIHGHRSASLVWAIAGALASGASYVVLDAQYPSARLATLLEIAEPTAWLALESAGSTPPDVVAVLDELGLEHRLTLPSDLDDASMDDHFGVTASDVENAATVEIGPDDPACLTFTSGSTGEPKAVVGRHGSLTHFFPWMSEEFDIGEQDRFSMLSGLSHDPLQRDLFWPLSLGAAIVVPDPDHIASPGYLADWLRGQRVSVVHLTPAMGQLVTEHARLGAEGAVPIDGLRVALFIGDVLTRAQVTELTALAPNVRTVNLYGTTETQRASGYHVVDLDGPTAADLRGKEVLPLGRGLPGCQLLVHGRTGRPAAVGEIGDIVMRGPHLALGYHNDDTLTRERFDVDPHQSGSSQLYRTGDCGRYRADGSVEFLGRSDDQVQLRGFRIEPGEIAATIRHEPGIVDAFVEVRADPADHPRLVAHVVSNADEFDPGALSTSLRSTLPAHMVPTDIVRIDRVPLTPNGKVDRRALPDPFSITGPVEFVAPRDDLERTVVAIWQQVLGRDDIGIDDDFFALGGFSLLATRVLALVEDATDMRLPIAALFHGPTVRELASSVRNGAWRQAVPPITPAIEQAAVPSYTQERMWFLDQFEDERHSLVVGAALALHGTLDASALQASLDTIYNRHDVLRTLITSESGSPQPVVLPAGRMPLEIHDVDGDTEAAATVQARLAEHAFHLDSEPPIVVGLVRISDDHHILSVLMHHVASDASSLGLFFGELQTLYQAEVSGTAPELPPLDVQYGDYASWQRLAASDLFDEQLEFWREQLEGPLPTFEIAPDFQRPDSQTLAGARIVAHVPAEVSAGLADLAAENGATMFMALLAGFDIVLARHADQTDVIVGTPVSGRVRPELEPLIGAFLNTVIVRTDLGGSPSVRSVLERVRDASLGAFDNQDVPFELLLNEMRVPRDRSRSPLFQVFFNMTRHDVGDTIALPGFRTEVLGQADRGSKFDITMYANHGADGTDLALVYKSSLYQPEHMQRLLDQYLHVLAEMVLDPDRSIDDLSLVTDADRVLVPDASVALDDAWHGSVPAAVRRAAADHPDRVAISDGHERWSYDLLETQMSNIASWLLDRGVGRGDVVAILAQRSGSLVPAMTGALAAGATYLLLDPNYPGQRLAMQLRSARPSAWIALDAAGDAPAEVSIALDELEVEHRLTLPSAAESTGFEPLADEDDSAVADAIAAIGPDDPACLTFTSGSTGTPKAVLGRHGSLTHFLPWMSEEFEVGSDDRFSMLSGLAHDPIQRDVFWPLWLGATIVVPDPESIGTAGWIARWMRDESITVAHLTPAMGTLLAEPAAADADDVSTVPSLRRALFIGDALTRRDVERLQERAPAVRVVNLYGTTETQRASGFHTVDLDETPPVGALSRQVLPLGRGMPGSQLLVRTATGASTAIGEIGEIAMRSPHLALGYFDDDRTTAQRFAADPAGRTSQDQVYATGDRGRYRVDGSVEFLGRNDDQVEIRGFRVELGEIVAVLRSQPAVAEAVAHVWTDDQPDDAHGSESIGGSRSRLVAYIRCEADSTADTAALLASLRASLPAHMVPASIVEIDRIPLTPNGKVDRSALPAPTVRSPTDDDGPIDSLERMLIDMWARVLGHDTVGVHDDFFELGGYSLLATRLFAMIEERTGSQLPISVLFEHPTIRSLAGAIRDEGWTPSWSSLVPIQPSGSRQPFFYVSAFLMSVLELAPLGAELGDDQPLYGLQPLGLDGTVEPHSRIEDMAAHYIREMKSVQPEGPYALGGHCAGSWVAFEMARQLEADGEELSALVLVDQGPPGLQRAAAKSPSYIWGRIRFYFSGGRLRHALAWSLKIATDRFLLSRAGSQASRVGGAVKDAHRVAHRNYEGGPVRQDLALILSADSMSLADKAWYTLWSDMTDASLTTYEVGGTHALMLVEPHVTELAAALHTILGTAPRDDG